MLDSWAQATSSCLRNETQESEGEGGELSVRARPKTIGGEGFLAAPTVFPTPPPFIFSTHLLAFFMGLGFGRLTFCLWGFLGVLPGSGATFCDLFAFFAFFFFTARSGCDVGGGSANFTLLVVSLRRWGREERNGVSGHDRQGRIRVRGRREKAAGAHLLIFSG